MKKPKKYKQAALAKSYVENGISPRGRHNTILYHGNYFIEDPSAKISADALHDSLTLWSLKRILDQNYARFRETTS
ncbi:unnamed protein product [Rhizophagus irregularis]|nr:unnamed protein product [Rhizophagus irregularis]